MSEVYPSRMLVCMVYGEIESNHMTQLDDFHGSLHLQASHVFILILWSCRGLSSFFLASSVYIYAVTSCIFLTSRLKASEFRDFYVGK